MPATSLGHGVSIATDLWQGPIVDYLNPSLVELLAKLHRQFEPVRSQLMRERKLRQAQYDRGECPQYLPQNSQAQKEKWSVATLPKDLLRRRVEITGPVNDAKMVINMLSANADGIVADTAMLDFEDSMMPAWTNVVSGLQNVLAVAKEELSWKKLDSKGQVEKEYRLNPKQMALPMVRVRGLHLDESNIKIDGQAISAGLFDLVSCAFLSAKTFLSKGKTPKYYIPKCEHHLEARWWNDLLTTLEKALDLPISTLRCTLLIETLPAAFQMEEILYEIRQHAAALNVGRWDKIFSDIKVLKNHPDRVSADRAKITMLCPWMENYAKRLVKICHEHGAMAIGGMSAFTPGKEAELRQVQTQKVIADKTREFDWGHDGCWVSHPYFITHAMGAFTRNNQLDKLLSEFPRCPDLLMPGSKDQSLSGLRTNIRVGIAYMQGWNKGLGCVAWDDLMEDLATLEISRAQTWQWLHHGVTLQEGKKVDSLLVRQIFTEELQDILHQVKPTVAPHEWPKLEIEFIKAKDAAQELFLKKELPDFLTFASPEASSKEMV